MIVDVTGTELIPGCGGLYCPGNGQQKDLKGNPIECCCEEFDYYMCCLENHSEEECEICFDRYCPHAKKKPARKET